ncbi:MAG: hypothetical protein EOM10_03315, partial [Opitutae bacterium]|nr:hypothetical protein [Opitutae bacterium]
MNENKKRCAVGVDFGGTFVKMARVAEDGTIGARASFATTDLKGVEGWLDEEMALLDVPPPGEEAAAREAYLRIRAAAALGPRELAALRELAE